MSSADRLDFQSVSKYFRKIRIYRYLKSLFVSSSVHLLSSMEPLIIKLILNIDRNRLLYRALLCAFPRCKRLRCEFFLG